MVFSPLQAQNGFAPIYRMESGMETKVNVSQDRNALSPIEVTFFRLIPQG